MANIQRISICLWFDNQAEDAARFYTSIFRNSSINEILRYSDVGQEIHGKPPGTVLTVQFELNGQRFTALNGGPMFKFSEAVSLEINCETQEEIDYYWEKLSEGGDERAQQCGWLKDRYGLSWQVVPAMISDLFRDENSEGSKRAMAAMLGMKKLDIAELKRAYEG